MEKKPPNLRLVTPGEVPILSDLPDLELAVKRMRLNQNAIFAFNREYAKILRNEYEEYVAAGFTQAQAMKLVAAKMTPPAK